jgi:hypothetical protein
MTNSSEYPPMWITIPVIILAIPVYLIYLVLWLAWSIFNFGTSKTWNGVK